MLWGGVGGGRGATHGGAFARRPLPSGPCRTLSAAEASTDSSLACGLALVTQAACSMSAVRGMSSVYTASPVTWKVARG